MGSKIQRLATDLIHTYFTTQLNPLVRHHIDSYDQFLQEGIQATIQSNNPLIILKNPKGSRDLDNYKYKVEIYIGGLQGDEIFV